MISISSLEDQSRMLSASGFTVEDFRNISFIMESGSDSDIYSFLDSKIQTHCRAFDKFYVLFKLRMIFVNDLVLLNNGKSDITINLSIWENIITNKYKDISKKIICDNIAVVVNYPLNLIYDGQDLLEECIECVCISGQTIHLHDILPDHRKLIIDKLPPILIKQIWEYIYGLSSEKIILMEEKLGLPEISINLFDGSAFDLLKVLFNYYTYEGIAETLFMLSRRVPDIQYLSSRTPKELDLIIRLYSEDVDKLNPVDKITI